MGLKSFINSLAETKELHSDITLRSRYYKANYSKIKNVIMKYAELNKLDVQNVDDVHREILLQSRKYHIIISIVQVSPIESSVDLKIEVYSMIGMGRPRKQIINFYSYLDTNLEFKGVGLHP